MRLREHIHFDVMVTPARWVIGVEIDAHSWPYLRIACLCFDIRIIQRPRTRDDQGNVVFCDRLVTWQRARVFAYRKAGYSG